MSIGDATEALEPFSAYYRLLADYFEVVLQVVL